MAGVQVEPGPLRANLSVPLPPAGRAAAAARRALTTLREPAFGRAQSRTQWWLVLGVALVVLARIAVVDPLQTAVTVCGLAVAGYAVLRAVTILLLERRQHTFEPVWLAERSKALRAGHFELLRFSVDGRTYDLGDSDTVRELLHRTDGGRVVLNFADDEAVLERVHRSLGDIEFKPVLRPGKPVSVRFPEGRYEVQPSGRHTFWLLGKPVVVTAVPGGRGAARGGIRSTDPPVAALPAGARRPGRS